MTRDGDPEAKGGSTRRRESQSVTAVHDRIRGAILDGSLEAGASVPQHLLAERFDAGRTPLREALRMIQREGLIVAEPNHPVRVAPLSADAFEELYVQRIALETVALRIALPLLGSEDFAELEAAMARMEHYRGDGDERAFRVPHRAFHRRLIEGSGPEIADEIDLLADHSERYRLSFAARGAPDDSSREHRNILDAVKSGDPDTAVEALAAHHALAATLVFGATDPGREARRLRVVLDAVAPGAAKVLSAA